MRNRTKQPFESLLPMLDGVETKLRAARQAWMDVRNSNLTNFRIEDSETETNVHTLGSGT